MPMLRTAEVAREEGGARGDADAVEGVVGEPVPEPREDEAEVLMFLSWWWWCICCS